MTRKATEQRLFSKLAEGFANLDRLGKTLVTNEVLKRNKRDERDDSNPFLEDPAAHQESSLTSLIFGAPQDVCYENSAKTLSFQLDGRAVFGASIDRAANTSSHV